MGEERGGKASADSVTLTSNLGEEEKTATAATATAAAALSSRWPSSLSKW